MKLIAKNISKSYKDKEVLKNFSLELNQGIIGLLGPNGAGKSTLMKIWATAHVLFRNDEGLVWKVPRL